MIHDSFEFFIRIGYLFGKQGVFLKFKCRVDVAVAGPIFFNRKESNGAQNLFPQNFELHNLSCSILDLPRSKKSNFSCSWLGTIKDDNVNKGHQELLKANCDGFIDAARYKNLITRINGTLEAILSQR